MLKLVKLEEKYKEQLFEMMDEWSNSGEKIIPYAIRKADYHNFDLYRESIEVKEETENSVLDSTYFALDIERNIFVGAVNIRHYLNNQLLKNGGHIGDGIRPSERRKGYATEMIRLALEECKKIGIDRVLMVCYKDNIGSRKSIINNGGVLENEIPAEDGKIDQRYWISLKKRYADRHVGRKANKSKQKVMSVKEKYFTGDIYFYNFIEVEDKIVIPNGKCIMDNNYKWLEFYDYNSKVKLTAIYDENNEIIEWYFDIAREIGKEKETKAPKGYQLSDKVVKIEINDKGTFADGELLEDNDSICTFTYYNKLIPKVQTGNEMNYALLIGSMIISLLGFTTGIIILKKNKKENN